MGSGAGSGTSCCDTWSPSPGSRRRSRRGWCSGTGCRRATPAASRSERWRGRSWRNGQGDKELLARHGLSAALLDDLVQALAQYDASVEESSLGRRDHVAARAELNAVSREILNLAELLDGLNRYRFGS
jgi:hypothetical protein